MPSSTVVDVHLQLCCQCSVLSNSLGPCLMPILQPARVTLHLNFSEPGYPGFLIWQGWYFFSFLFMVCLVLAVVSLIKAQYKGWWKPHPAQSKRYPGCREPFMKVVSRQVASSRWRYVNRYDDFVIGPHPLPVKMSLHWWKRSDSTAPLFCWKFTASLRVIIVLAEWSEQLRLVTSIRLDAISRMVQIRALHWAASVRETCLDSFSIEWAVFFIQVRKTFGLFSFLSYNSLQGSIRSACKLVSKHILPMACIAQLSTLLCCLVDIS